MGAHNQVSRSSASRWPTITWSERIQRLEEQGLKLPPINIERDDEGYVYAKLRHEKDFSFYEELLPDVFEDAILIYLSRYEAVFQLGRAH